MKILAGVTLFFLIGCGAKHEIDNFMEAVESKFPEPANQTSPPPPRVHQIDFSKTDTVYIDAEGHIIPRDTTYRDKKPPQ